MPTYLVIVLGVLANYLKSRREYKQTVQRVDAVQETVNGTHLELTDRVDQLTQSLPESGVAVPEKPAHAPPKG